MHKLFVDRGTRRQDRAEHFGFRDGIPVPAVRGCVDGEPLAKGRPPDDPLADRYSSTGRPLVWPGQAVFGYPGPNRTSVVEPGETVHGGQDWMDDGSFLVFRRLRQHVDAFHAFLAQAAERLTYEAEREVRCDEVVAMLVGRWPDGSPLIRHPREPGGYDIGVNDFRFFTETPKHTLVDESKKEGERNRIVNVGFTPADPDGERCPHFAHIRNANPRDAPTDLAGEAMAFALQPLRRGIPYEDGGERGLLFLAYTTAIEARFGALSRGWINQRGVPEPRSAVDPLIGPPPADGVRTIEFQVGDRRYAIEAPSRWVDSTGGGFFFSPSMDLLTRLAGTS
jgi:Dyp-type peroxidase family